MPYTLDIDIISATEEIIDDFMALHPNSYVVIKDEKTNRVIVEIKGTIEFEFVKGIKTISLTAKEMPEENLPITLPPHQFKVNEDGTITVYHRENINPIKVFSKKKTTRRTKKKHIQSIKKKPQT